MTNSILGHRVLRREDPALLTTGGTYVDDLAERGEDGLAGALFVTFLRSSVAHARFTVDATDAREAPGVVAILTVDDLDLPDVAVARPMQAAMARPLLARDVVRFVGEPIAAILTEERAQGPDAAEQIVDRLIAANRLRQPGALVGRGGEVRQAAPVIGRERLAERHAAVEIGAEGRALHGGVKIGEVPFRQNSEIGGRRHLGSILAAARGAPSCIGRNASRINNPTTCPVPAPPLSRRLP